MEDSRFLLALAVWGLSVSAAASTGLSPKEIRGGDLAVRLSNEGHIVAATLGKKRLPWAVSGETILTGCRDEGKPAVRAVGDGVEVTRHLVHEAGKNRCLLVERLLRAQLL